MGQSDPSGAERQGGAAGARLQPLLLAAGLAFVAYVASKRPAVPRGAVEDAVRETLPASDRDDPHAEQRADAAARGRHANAPHEIPARGWKDILWRTYAQLGEDRVLAVAAGVTFYVLLALFPAIVALVSLYGLVSDPAMLNQHLGAFAFVLPSGAMDIVRDQVTRIVAKGSGTLSFAFFGGLLVALWSANAGMKAMFDALNVVYGETEKRSFLALNAMSLLFTLCAMALAICAFSAIVVIPAVLAYFGLKASDTWIGLLRWPGLLVVVVAALTVLYRYGPSRRRAKWRWLTWGAAIATLAWLAASAGFSWYVANFGTYNETYGSLGAAIGFMTWIWLSSAIVLMGGELNAEIEHQTAQDSTKGSGRPRGARGARMADEVAA